MKYTDRKKTPLKWHRTVSFLLMPLVIIGLAYLLVCMSNELFGMHITALPYVFTPILQEVSPSLSIRNLGSMFWPVTGTFFGTILLLILVIWVWTGFLRWKNYARNLWLIYLLARVVCVLGAAVTVMTRSDMLKALRMFAAFDSMSRTFLHFFYAILIVISLWNVIFLILNFMYYRKRKPLFQKNYIQPSSENVNEQTSTDQVTDAQQQTGPGTSSHTETSSTPEHIPEPEETKEPAADQKEETTPDSENKSADSVEEEKTESETDQKEADASEKPEKNPDHVFCPYCGAKLGPYDVNYCSHCGRRLS